MAFPWDNLISAAAGVIGGLGGAGVTGHLALKREQAAADNAAAAAKSDRQREAYATLLVTSRAALRNFRQLRIAYWADTPDTPEVREAVEQAGALAAELSHATALVELLGSDGTRGSAREIYAKARVCANLYQARSIGLAMIKGGPTNKTPAQFDVDRAQKLCDELDAAIETFADAARDEISGTVHVEPRK